MGINLDFKENSISWGDYQADMKDTDVTLAEHIAKVEATTMAAAKIAKILNIKYQKVDLCTDVLDLCKALNTKEKENLLCIMQKQKELFDSTLGTWKNIQYNIELQEGIKQYHSRPYTVPKAYELSLIHI
eukprot:374138-Ditylum_brightwellii.AAC.1